MNNKMKNTVALVTGGASGIGKAVANRIIDNGGRVLIIDSNPAGQEVAENFGDRARFIKADVTSEKDVKEAIDFAKKTFGGLNVVVNSAGIGAAEKLYDFETNEPHSLDVYKKIMDVNALGTFNVTRLCAGTIAANAPDENDQRGVIINISSNFAHGASADSTVAYAASKAAVSGMTLPLARALAPKGIRVVAVAPGFTDTPMLRAAIGEGSADLFVILSQRNLSPKRQGTPDEIAHVIQCIIENAFINAEVIQVDGGYRWAPE